MSPNKMS